MDLRGPCGALDGLHVDIPLVHAEGDVLRHAGAGQVDMLRNIADGTLLFSDAFDSNWRAVHAEGGCLRLQQVHQRALAGDADADVGLDSEAEAVEYGFIGRERVGVADALRADVPVRLQRSGRVTRSVLPAESGCGG